MYAIPIITTPPPAYMIAFTIIAVTIKIIKIIPYSVLLMG
jgi:hypothetical protein